MFKLSNTIAGLATLTLATVPALALATGAHAAPAVVKVSDIDMASTHGARTLAKRITSAAHDICEADGKTTLGTRAACIKSVRYEAEAQIEAHHMAAKAAPTQLARR